MHYDFLGIFAAGLLTFASPCILPLAPVYLGLLGGASIGELRARTRVARTIVAAIAFSVGLSLVFVALGMAATTLGHALVEHRALFLQLGGLVVFLFGLKYLGVLNLSWLERDFRPGLGRARGGSAFGALVMGAAFGLGWTPCIGPVLGSVLTFTATATSRPLDGALYLAVYAAGISLPLVAAAMVAPFALGWLQRAQRWLRPLQLATGGLLAIIGLLLLTDHLGVLEPVSTSSKQALEAVAPAPPRSPTSQRAGEISTAGDLCSAGLSNTGACALPKEGVFENGVKQAVVSGPAMVEFVGRACPVCLRMVPVVKAVERACAGHQVQIQRVEVDGPGGRDLAQRFGVFGVPTFLFFDAKGAEVARLVGEQPLASLEQSLQVLSGEECAGFRTFPSVESASPVVSAPASR